METKVKALHEEARLPRYGYRGDAGMDLAVVGRHVLNPGESRDLPTGIAVEMPDDHWGRITGRSSTLRKRGLFINEGVIDSGYRGELLVYVTNRQSTAVVVEPGDRLAQLIIQPVVQAPAEWTQELSESDRGTNGFGSTDVIEDPSIPVPHYRPANEADAVRTYRWGDPEMPPSTKVTFAPGAVYLGGAVDYGSQTDNDDWRHRGWSVPIYCPMCECADIDIREPQTIISRNMHALYEATDAVFVLLSFTVGTPIEAWQRIMVWRKPAIIVCEMPGVFVTRMGEMPGVALAQSIDEARGLVLERAVSKVFRNT